MSDIDPEAAGILIASGVDVPTALAGSIINEPSATVPPKSSTGTRTPGIVGFLIGLAVMLAYLLWQMS